MRGPSWAAAAEVGGCALGLCWAAMLLRLRWAAAGPGSDHGPKEKKEGGREKNLLPFFKRDQPIEFKFKFEFK